MRARVMGKANAALAALLAFVFAFSLLGIPAPALAETTADNPGEEQAKPITVSGADFLQPTAQGWELLKVDNLSDQAIYITVKKDGKPLSNPFKYTADMNQAGSSEDYAGSGAQIAQIVGVQMRASTGATEGQTAAELLGDPTKHSTYTVEVSNALMQGDTLYSGTLYPVYGKLVNKDQTENQTPELVLLGIRTADKNEVTKVKNLGVGQTYYKQNTTEDAYPIAYSIPSGTVCDNTFDEDLQAYIVTYEQNSADSVEGVVNYVDPDGKVVKTETFSGIDQDGKVVHIKKSFTAADPENAETINYYRAISSLGGTKVMLTPSQASYTVLVMPVKNMDEQSYDVVVKYVDEHGSLLWSDTVGVAGYGYRYTLPNTFSMNKQSGVDSADGVNFYRLDAGNIQGGKVVESDNKNGTALEFTANLTDSDFVMEDGKRTVVAAYDSQDATKEVTFTLVEVDGETGTELGRVVQTVTPDPATNVSYMPEKKEFNGKTYVPWAGNTEEIVYTWESLGQSVDLLQYVYYVPEDFVPGDAYDITVQYMNIANGAVLRTETLTVDPEITNYVEVQGVERFTQDGNEYVRLAGQETGIRHAYFSPDRTYTIYYRDVDDVINANTTVTRTQIIETTRTVTVPGGGITAAPAPIAAPAAGAPAADAGVAPGAGTTIINDDDNPLAGLDGQDTATERSIADNENPLASGAAGMNWGLIAGIGFGVIAVAGIVAYALLRRKRKKNEQNA